MGYFDWNSNLDEAPLTEIPGEMGYFIKKSYFWKDGLFDYV